MSAEVMLIDKRQRVRVDGKALEDKVLQIVADLTRFGLPVTSETIQTRLGSAQYVVQTCVTIEDLP